MYSVRCPSCCTKPASANTDDVILDWRVEEGPGRLEQLQQPCQVSSKRPRQHRKHTHRQTPIGPNCSHTVRLVTKLHLSQYWGGENTEQSELEWGAWQSVRVIYHSVRLPSVLPQNYLLSKTKAQNVPTGWIVWLFRMVQRRDDTSSPIRGYM